MDRLKIREWGIMYESCKLNTRIRYVKNESGLMDLAFVAGKGTDIVQLLNSCHR